MCYSHMHYMSFRLIFLSKYLNIITRNISPHSQRDVNLQIYQLNFPVGHSSTTQDTASYLQSYHKDVCIIILVVA